MTLATSLNNQPCPLLPQAIPEESVLDPHSSEEQTSKTTNWVIFEFFLGQKSHEALAICTVITAFQNWILCPSFQSPGLSISPSNTHTAQNAAWEQLGWALLTPKVK